MYLLKTSRRRLFIHVAISENVIRVIGINFENMVVYVIIIEIMAPTPPRNFD